jgi:hypothetical protein
MTAKKFETVLIEKQGRYAEAEPLHKRSLVIWEKALGPDHRATLWQSAGARAEVKCKFEPARG